MQLPLSMDPDQIVEYWMDDAGGGSDGDLQCALESFCDIPPSDPGVGFQETFGDACCLEQNNSTKRARDETCPGTKSKACREKMRRDKLNDRFLELSSVLDPGRPPKSDKGTILSDAARLLVQLRSEAEELKESNEKLQDAIKDLKADKNEIRDEKIRLKAEKERLEQKLKSMTPHPPGFLPHPMALHPANAYAVQGQTIPADKAAPHFAGFPGIGMWQWLPSGVVNTTQDTKFWPPNA